MGKDCNIRRKEKNMDKIKEQEGMKKRKSNNEDNYKFTYSHRKPYSTK